MSQGGVAKFFKVDLERYITDFQGFIPYKEQGGTSICESADRIRGIYESIKLPKRATLFSAGYDFFSPVDFILKPNETLKLPTGIRCKMDDDVVLMIYPRSSLGFKYRMMLENTVGIIDSDYFNAENQGHIFIKFTNHGEKSINIKAGEAFAQGIFTKYYLTTDDDVNAERKGGIGSTNE